MGGGGKGGGNLQFSSRRPPQDPPSHNSAGPVPLRTKARTYRTGLCGLFLCVWSPGCPVCFCNFCLRFSGSCHDRVHGFALPCRDSLPEGRKQKRAPGERADLRQRIPRNIRFHTLLASQGLFRNSCIAFVSMHQLPQNHLDFAREAKSCDTFANLCMCKTVFLQLRLPSGTGSSYL